MSHHCWDYIIIIILPIFCLFRCYISFIQNFSKIDDGELETQKMTMKIWKNMKNSWSQNACCTLTLDHNARIILIFHLYYSYCQRTASKSKTCKIKKLTKKFSVFGKSVQFFTWTPTRTSLRLSMQFSEHLLSYTNLILESIIYLPDCVRCY